MAEKIGLISLGCAKNLVDSEQMLWLLDEAGYEFTTDIDEADAVVVNTCGFIDEAKSEAIENILELCTIKAEKESKLRAIIVTGCLSERYRSEIYKEIPEVDAVLGCSALSEIVSAVKGALNGEKPEIFGDKNAPVKEIGRIKATPPYYAYVKLGEGCDNRCSYCAIPGIRGNLRSRTREAIIEECRALAADGAKELIIISQDITKYGMDLYGKSELPSLLKEICAIDGPKWVRLHYANPDGITDELIDVVASEPKIVKYLDIPIQHADDKVLSAMNRHYSAEYVDKLFTELRKRIPGLVLRSTVMVGFPGEGEKEFENLMKFLKKHRIERAGVFEFSPQEGTPAADMEDKVDEKISARRAERIRELQQGIMEKFEESFVGKKIDVICEGFDRVAEVWYGRSFADSPDVDGKVFFEAKKALPEGAMVKVQVTELMDGDLFGEAIQNF